MFYDSLGCSLWFLARIKSSWGALTSNQKLHKSIFDQKSSLEKANTTVRRLLWSPNRQTILMERAISMVFAIQLSLRVNGDDLVKTLESHHIEITAAAAQSISRPQLGQLIKIKISRNCFLFSVTVINEHNNTTWFSPEIRWCNRIMSLRIIITIMLRNNLITRDSSTKTTPRCPTVSRFLRLTHDQLSHKSARSLSACETIAAQQFMGQEVVEALTRERHQQHRHRSPAEIRQSTNS